MPVRYIATAAAGRTRRLSVAEVAYSGGDHRRAGCVDGRDDLLVAHRAAWLDDRADARVERQLRTVGEGEVGVGGKRRSRERVSAEFLGPLDGDTHGVHAAHLPRADADGGAAGGEHDRVGP